MTTQRNRRPGGEAAAHKQGGEPTVSVTHPAVCSGCDIAACDAPDPYTCPVHGELHRWHCFGRA
jgi:hypothetical protein